MIHQVTPPKGFKTRSQRDAEQYDRPRREVIVLLVLLCLAVAGLSVLEGMELRSAL